MRKYVYNFKNKDTSIKFALSKHLKSLKNINKFLNNCTEYSFVEDLNFNNRYYLFGGETYYPQGGFQDLLLTSNKISDFIPIIKNRKFLEDGIFGVSDLDWVQIVDKKLNTVILNDSIEASSKNILEIINKEANQEIFIESLKKDIVIS